MVSKNQIKLINSLQQKKFRNLNNLFFAEGQKVIHELLNSDFKLNHLFATETVFDDFNVAQKTLISQSELDKISALATSNSCLAIFEIPKDKKIENADLIVVLDDIRDPGNLGTIIRLCDWFGITQIICSQETVDVYNPKVVQATMGSIARVAISYCDLVDFISKSELPVYGTFMDGAIIYMNKLPSKAMIVMGNEANGISEKIEELVQKRISIPRFGEIQKTESLNVATATAIILSEFKRDFI
jgi:RNA methyltransferase, TrmH family